MLRTLLFIVVIFLCFEGQTQNEWSIKVLPQRLFNPLTPMIPIEIEFQKNNFGIAYEHGIQTPHTVFKWNPNTTNNTYFRSQLSLRYYINSESIQQYFSLQTAFIPWTYTKNNDWYTISNTDYVYNSAKIAFNILKATANYGLKLPINDCLYFEITLGAGVKYNSVKYQIVENKAINDGQFWDEWFSPRDRKEGVWFAPTALLQFKFAYTFFKAE